VLPETQIVINEQIVLPLTTIVFVSKLPQYCSDRVTKKSPLLALLSADIFGSRFGAPIRFPGRHSEACKASPCVEALRDKLVSVDFLTPQLFSAPPRFRRKRKLSKHCSLTMMMPNLYILPERTLVILF
jgi:hypothetical protein